MEHGTEKNQQGITLYLAIVTLSAALATALFVAGALTKEYNISTSLFDSLKAVYVADSVTEYTLYLVRTATYDSTAKTITISPGGSSVIINTTALTTLLSNTNCATAVNLTNGGICSISGELVPTNGTYAGCPSDTLNPPPNCIYLKANGSAGGTNRAMEIVYDNK